MRWPRGIQRLCTSYMPRGSNCQSSRAAAAARQGNSSCYFNAM
ncbi:hypothetical protein ETAE_2628 [Edwardsiella piscicida]|uniref:Uncharacterized protein n=2 Tax=Edwardsiella TaxID=635 RepID=A0A0H3DWY2_EDWTF|nr:hypothetical protein ETAE_2628 [Edwardsiella tarda EIB202]ADM42469.1 hypothetical protein ETAF_2366 [Edwardsiella tarda FL6-60]